MDRHRDVLQPRWQQKQKPKTINQGKTLQSALNTSMGRRAPVEASCALKLAVLELTLDTLPNTKIAKQAGDSGTVLSLCKNAEQANQPRTHTHSTCVRPFGCSCHVTPEFVLALPLYNSVPCRSYKHRKVSKYKLCKKCASRHCAENRTALRKDGTPCLTRGDVWGEDWESWNVALLALRSQLENHDKQN